MKKVAMGPIEAVDDATISSVRRAIIRTLVAAYPRNVHSNDLIVKIWRGDCEGRNLRVHICQLNKALAPYGWRVVSKQGQVVLQLVRPKGTNNGKV